jgi:hypothetical protein
MSELFYVSCAVCGRRDRIPSDTQEHAFEIAEEKRGWQVVRFEGTANKEVRCPKHWAAGKHD